MANYSKSEIAWMSDVVRAANSYPLPGRTIQSTANALKVSTNQLTTWFCEAIAQGFITSDTLCVMIMNKHIAEYEKNLNMSATSLRDLYKAALKKRFNRSEYMGLLPLPFALS